MLQWTVLYIPEKPGYQLRQHRGISTEHGHAIQDQVLSEPIRPAHEGKLLQDRNTNHVLEEYQ